MSTTSTHRRVLTALLTAAAVAADAGAFNYPEHREISASAIARYRAEIAASRASSEPDRAAATAPAPAGQAPIAAAEAVTASAPAGFDPYVTALRAVLSAQPDRGPAPSLCDAAAFGAEAARPRCFGAADIPALAADHAASPASLIARWFRDPARRGNGPLYGMLAAAGRVDRGYDTPLHCNDTTHNAAASDLLAVVRRYGRGTPRDARFDLDDKLMAADDAYLCLAASNYHHFRLSTLDPVAAAQSRVPNAAAAYARYHLTAVFLAHSARERDGAAATRLRGLAALYELFALHFIEDSVASGHAVTPIASSNASTALLTHNFYNGYDSLEGRRGGEGGVRMALPADLCTLASAPDRAPWVPVVAQRCHEPGPELIVHGDNTLAASPTAHARFDEPTWELAELAAFASLQEFVAAAAAPLPVGLGACGQAFATRGAARDPLLVTDPGITASDIDLSRLPECRQQSVVPAAVSGGLLSALRVLPSPIEFTAPVRGVAPGLLFTPRVTLGAGASWVPAQGNLARPTARAIVALGFSYAVPARGFSQSQVMIGVAAGPTFVWPGPNAGADRGFAGGVGGELSFAYSRAHWLAQLALGGGVYDANGAGGRSARGALVIDALYGRRGPTWESLALAWIVGPRLELLPAQGEVSLSLGVGIRYEHSFHRPPLYLGRAQCEDPPWPAYIP